MMLRLERGRPNVFGETISWLCRKAREVISHSEQLEGMLMDQPKGVLERTVDYQQLNENL